MTSKNFRPGYINKFQGKNWKVKEIFVNQILLYHCNFIILDLNIVVVSGVANVQIGDSFFILKKNESIYTS